MLAEVELNVLRWLDRTTLEELQIHSRFLRDLVDRYADSFPLRYIHEIKVSGAAFS